MKKQTVLKFMISIISLGLCPTASLANSELTKYLDVARQEMKSGQVSNALQSLRTGITTLESEFKPNNIIAAVESELQEHRQEVVVRNEYRRSSESLSFDTIFSILFGNIDFKSKSSIDVTKIITQNPKAVAQFPLKVREDLEKLRVKIYQHIESHINEIVMAKLLLIESYRIIAASDSSQWSSSITKNDLNEMDSFVQTYTFKGLQNITACVTTNYTDHVSHKEESTHAGLNLILFEIAYKQDSESTDTSKAYALIRIKRHQESDDVWN